MWRSPTRSRCFSSKRLAFDTVDILVNNAAWASPIAHFLEMTEEFWDTVLTTNLKSVFLCSQRAARLMAEQEKPGSIINISTYGAARAQREMVAYNASKGGLEAATRAMALDLAPWRIRVNAVGPGPIATPSFLELFNTPEKLDRMRMAVPLERLGEPADIAAAVAFFASDEAVFVTGQVLYVDGGSGSDSAVRLYPKLETTRSRDQTPGVDPLMNTAARTETIRMTMSQAVVKFLQAQYSERDGRWYRFIPAMFGIFGHGNVCGMGQALEECGQELPYYQPCNEQSMVHTAIGFAKANRRLATLACTASIGPGSTNMITGAATATINRMPVLLLPSDYFATRHQGPVLQQLEHPISADVSVNDCFRPVSRFFDRISRPEQLLTALPEAMRVLTDPVETGAVTIALPQDIQAHAYDYPLHFFERHVWRIERRLPDSQRITEAVRLLKEAERPVILAGGGVHYSEACRELQALAQALGIPVGETFAGKGALSDRSELALGGHGLEGTGAAAKIVSQADLVIVSARA